MTDSKGDVIATTVDGSNVTILQASPANEGYGISESPDGEWLAYRSQRYGENQIWVQPMRGGAPVQVSRFESDDPVWSRDGNRLYFSSAQTQAIWAAEVIGTEPGISFGPPELVINPEQDEFSVYDFVFNFFDVTKEGGIVKLLERSGTPKDASHLVVVQNWHEELKRLVPHPEEAK